MEKSAHAGFAPALADFGRFMGMGIGFPAADHKAARTMYRQGMKQVHIPSALFFAEDCRNFGGNLALRLFGYAAYPVARLLLILALGWFPFSQRVFHHVPAAKRPFFLNWESPPI
jgi:hypothetical protein